MNNNRNIDPMSSNNVINALRCLLSQTSDVNVIFSRQLTTLHLYVTLPPTW